MNVAKERAADAEATCKHRPNSVVAVYLAGYAIECSLKALLQTKGIPYPKRGREGHNLKALWQKSGFKLSDLRDSQGMQTFYLEQWSTNLRYETVLYEGLELEELMKGAKKLAGLIKNQIQRSSKGKKG